MDAPGTAFRLEMTAPASDVDDLGHVSNVAYVRWIQDAAVAASTACGYDFAAYKALGAVFVVRRHEIEYLSPAFGGDRIALFTWVESYRGVSTIRRTEIARVGDGKALVSAVTRWILVGTDDGRPKRISREMAARFGVSPTTEPPRRDAPR